VRISAIRIKAKNLVAQKCPLNLNLFPTNKHDHYGVKLEAWHGERETVGVDLPILRVINDHYD
jgi:hypothetical protein